jgi:hypothetical protein
MVPLERLFALEVEFQRRARLAGGDPGGLHTSYALQHQYEPILREAGRVTASEIKAGAIRMAMAGDQRDVLRARDALMRRFDIGATEV